MRTVAHRLPARQAPAKIPDRVVFRLMARRATPAATRRLTKDTIQLGLKVPSRQHRTCRRCPRYQPCPLHRRSRRSKRTRSREPAAPPPQQPRGQPSIGVPVCRVSGGHYDEVRPILWRTFAGADVSESAAGAIHSTGSVVLRTPVPATATALASIRHATRKNAVDSPRCFVVINIVVTRSSRP